MYRFAVWSRLAALRFTVYITIERFTPDAILAALRREITRRPDAECLVRYATYRVFGDGNMRGEHYGLEAFTTAYASKGVSGEKIEIGYIALDTPAAVPPSTYIASSSHHTLDGCGKASAPLDKTPGYQNKEIDTVPTDLSVGSAVEQAAEVIDEVRSRGAGGRDPPSATFGSAYPNEKSYDQGAARASPHRSDWDAYDTTYPGDTSTAKTESHDGEGGGGNEAETLRRIFPSPSFLADGTYDADSGRYGVPAIATASGRGTPAADSDSHIADSGLQRVETRDYLTDLEHLEGNTAASTRLLRIIQEEGVAPASQLGLKLLDLVKALRVNGELGPSSASSSAAELASAVASPVHKRLDQFAEMLDHIAFAVGVNIVEPDADGNTPALSPRSLSRTAHVENALDGLHLDGEVVADTDAARHKQLYGDGEGPLGLRPGVALNEAQRVFLGKLASPDRRARAARIDLSGSMDLGMDEHARQGENEQGGHSTSPGCSPHQELNKVLSAARNMQLPVEVNPRNLRSESPITALTMCPMSPTYSTRPTSPIAPFRDYPYQRLFENPLIERTAPHAFGTPSMPPCLPPSASSPYLQSNYANQSSAYMPMPICDRLAPAEIYTAKHYGFPWNSSNGQYLSPRPDLYGPHVPSFTYSGSALGSAAGYALDGCNVVPPVGVYGYGQGAAAGANANLDTRFRRVYPDLRALVPLDARDIYGR